jgi:hypothetical protein
MNWPDAQNAQEHISAFTTLNFGLMQLKVAASEHARVNRRGAKAAP